MACNFLHTRESEPRSSKESQLLNILKSTSSGKLSTEQLDGHSSGQELSESMRSLLHDFLAFVEDIFIHPNYHASSSN